MPEVNWAAHMSQLNKDRVVAEREKQRRKKFAEFGLPSSAYDWSDDQIHAYKGARDGLGMDPLKAEQYVNTHTDPKKPSGLANKFYPATEPTGFERDLNRKVMDRRHQISMKPDDGPPMSFASQSGHVLGEGEARRPELARAGTRPLFDEAAHVGRQTHYKEQADKLLANSNTQKPAEQSVRKKPRLTVKVGEETFEFKDAFTAKELMNNYPVGQAMMQSMPATSNMALVKGDDGKSYYVDPNSETYERLQEARNIQRAEVVADASAAATIVAPELAPITSITGGLASGYLLYNDPSLKNAVGAALGARGKALLKKMKWSDRAAEQGAAGAQLINSRFDYGEKK